MAEQKITRAQPSGPKKQPVVENDGDIVVRNVSQMSQIDHIKAKSMWAGSRQQQSIETYVVEHNENSSRFVKEKLVFVPAVLKVIDEIVVNATDQWAIYPKQVTTIQISIDANGIITVTNNGPGIELTKTKTIDGRELWSPQLIFTEFLTSSNFETKDSIVGGQNGIGAKLTVVYSKMFRIITIDGKRKQYYCQTVRDGMKIIEEPIVQPTSEPSGTSISFELNLEELGVDKTEFYPTLCKLVEARAWQITGFTSANVYFNGEHLNVKSFQQFCDMFTENEVHMFKMTSSDYPKYAWDVGFTLSDGKEWSISLINGLFVKGGTHIQHIQHCIVADFQPRIEQIIKKIQVKFNKNLLLNNLAIFVRGSIPNPDFLGQVKEAIHSPIENFAKYNMSAVDWTRLWNSMKLFIENIFSKKIIGEATKRVVRGRINVPKYEEAYNCAHVKHALQCGLICVEGKSACSTVRNGLLGEIKTSPNFNFSWYGTFDTGGVLINALKKSRQMPVNTKAKSLLSMTKIKTPDAISAEIKSDSESDESDESDCSDSSVTSKNKYSVDLVNNKSVPIPGQMLRNNERIISLMKVLGLDYNKRYELDSEFKTLRYGFIVGLVDQDLDGFNIFGLICTFILTYWPALAKRNFIRRINTPLIRVFMGKTAVEFYSENHFDEWHIRMKSDPATAKLPMKIKYYKGLAGHDFDTNEIKSMFSEIDDKICTYVLDADTIKKMQIYYGEATKPRKVVLRVPPPSRPPLSKQVSFSQHFDIDTREFQRDTLLRRIKSMYDGQLDSSRKVLFAVCHQRNPPEKLINIAAEVMRKTVYEHGDASLCEVIVKMAQSGIMARNIPLLIKHGSFGTRRYKYEDHGQTRYISAANNFKLNSCLFLREDEYVLDYIVSEGETHEPVTYYPIIPLAIVESISIPGTGWNCVVHARHIDDIFKNIRDMITGKIKKCQPLRYWLRGFKGSIEVETDAKTGKTKEYYVGKYIFDVETNVLKITELPIGVCSQNYVEGTEKAKKSKLKTQNSGIRYDPMVVESEVFDRSQDDTIDIQIKLVEGAADAIANMKNKNGTYKYGGKDPFIEYFRLKEAINHHINFINEKGEVIEFKTYEDVFDAWYEKRKEMYKKRLERELIILKAKIAIYKNMQRFSVEKDSYCIDGKMAVNELMDILSDKKYDKVNKSLVFMPSRFTAEELISAIYAENGKHYDYLIDMTIRDMTKTEYADRARKIQEAEDRIKLINDPTNLFIGANIWLQELKELESVIAEGIATKWTYANVDIEYVSGESFNIANHKPRPRKGKAAA